MSRNTNNAPSQEEIRNAGAIPFASQIPNDSEQSPDFVGELLDNAPEMVKVLVSDLSIETLNDEQSADAPGDAAHHLVPITAIVHMVDVGAGAAAAGDFEITIGITSGGTEILSATACTGVIGINTKLAIDLLGVAVGALPADSEIFVKVTKADTTAGAGHLAKCYLVCGVVPAA